MRNLIATILLLGIGPFGWASVDNAATLRFDTNSLNAQLCADLRNPGIIISELQKISRSCNNQAVEVVDASVALLAARAADEFYTYCKQTDCASRYDLDVRIYKKQPVAKRIRKMAEDLYEKGRLGPQTAQFIWNRVWLVGPVLPAFALKHWADTETDQAQKNIATVRKTACAHQASLGPIDQIDFHVFEEFLKHVCAVR